MTGIYTSMKFGPDVGEVYENVGGGMYRCLMIGDGSALMRNVLSGWTFIAHGLGVYADGRIDWDYSTDGKFMMEDKPW